MNEKRPPNPTDATETQPPAPPALSARQLAARRANALKTTGPRTPEGKAASRLNALTHGFFARDVVSSKLDGPARTEEFNLILDALLEDFDPQSARERILVEEVAACCWRIRRLMRYECRESWLCDDGYRRRALTQDQTDALLSTMGYDPQGNRERTYRRLRRAGLHALILPDDSDIDRIVRFERLIKRNLYRALNALEFIQAGRIAPRSSGESPE